VPHTSPLMTDADPESDDVSDDVAPKPARGSVGDPARAVLAALRKVTKPSSPAELAEATGLTEATVRRTLGRLVSLRDARRAGGDRYSAAKHPR
jgi:hypothetical protein